MKATLFATVVCLLLVPATYLILDDATTWLEAKLSSRRLPAVTSEASAPGG